MDKSLVLWQLLQSGKYSDLVLECQDRTFNVHKSVVCTQSSMMAAAVDNFEEGQSNCIKVAIVDSRILEKLIEFMYRGDYKIDTENKDAPTPASSSEETMHDIADKGLYSDSITVLSPILQHIRVGVAANYYHIPALVDLATKRLKTLVSVERLVPDFASGLTEVFNASDDKEMQEAMAAVASRNIKTLLNQNEFLELDDISDCSVAIMTHMRKSMLPAIAVKNFNVRLKRAASLYRSCSCNAYNSSFTAEMVQNTQGDDLSLDVMMKCNGCGKLIPG